MLHFKNSITYGIAICQSRSFDHKCVPKQELGNERKFIKFDVILIAKHIPEYLIVN